MGLNLKAINDTSSVNSGLIVTKQPSDYIIALAGNPNVGKSTLFNLLTKMKQHTGNWPGKTVCCAQGRHISNGSGYVFVDLPGTYSLMAHSNEEEVARDFICFGGADATVVVCDATCLERNLNLVLQTIEITKRVVVCVNLMDEAKKKNIHINLDLLEENLGVPVVSMSARNGDGVQQLITKLYDVINNPVKAVEPKYIAPIENAISMIEPALKPLLHNKISSRFAAIKLLCRDIPILTTIEEHIPTKIVENNEIQACAEIAFKQLEESGISIDLLPDKIASCLVLTAEGDCCDVVSCDTCKKQCRDRKLDKILTNRITGVPIMLGLLALVLWITITGANVPSQLLSTALFWVQDRLTDFFHYINAPEWLHGMLILGVYHVLAWVVSVMLPPMAIFFPLFTILEDFGYLPRVAFNLDHSFKKANTCGKQALTMCMGFGCNASGVVGCRIIDSPRERLIATITNSFVPCNGRFPTLIAISTMFFAGIVASPYQSTLSTLMLTGLIVLGILATFLVSRLLSVTVLKGVASSFALELPPYRVPQFGKVIVRSLLDRTLYVLSRAIIVAAPAGLIIWIMANISVGNMTLLAHSASFLDPFARLLGLDGVILLAFILGFPANEIVVPIIIMTYMATGTIVDFESLPALKTLFVDNGWTWVTAICTMIFCLFHWPCSTTCLTIKKETQSVKWTALSFILPTAVGMLACFLFNTVAKLFV